MSEKLLDTKAASQFLGVPTETLKKWRQRGKHLKFVHIGRSVRYDVEDLLSFINVLKTGAVA